MHIDKFLAMLNDNTLYFPNVYSYNDKFEGTLSKKSIDEICKISLLDERNIPKRKSLRELDPTRKNGIWSYI